MLSQQYWWTLHLSDPEKTEQDLAFKQQSEALALLEQKRHTELSPNQIQALTAMGVWQTYKKDNPKETHNDYR